MLSQQLPEIPPCRNRRGKPSRSSTHNETCLVSHPMLTATIFRRRSKGSTRAFHEKLPGGKGSFQTVKLQRSGWATVCSQSTKDMAAIVPLIYSES